MKNILTIAKWEISRLRSRFGGKSKFVMLPVILLAIILSFTIYHQDFAVGKGLFTIGTTSNVPSITDPRFNTVLVNPSAGKQMLNAKSIDVLIDGDKVLVRKDQRSQYAAGALQKYLEKQELSRVAGQYSIDQAFPLRIQIGYLDSDQNSAGAIAEIDTQGSDAPAPSITVPVPEPELSSAPSLSESVTSLFPGASTPQATESYVDDSLQFNPTPDGPVTSSAVTNDDSQPIVSESTTDSAVQQQLDQLGTSGKLPEFKAQFVSENEVIVPSLMNPPMPLAQVIIAFLYIIPMFFVSVFFTSSFTEEKVNHKLIILLSAPVSQLQVILGKMLPYYVYSILAISAVTTILHGNLLLALAIFVPVMLFIFSIYLIVALTYRTFKDQTFFSVLALSLITVYLVVPAMFTGVNDLSFISPLTLAVTMYRGESFGLGQYLIATLPCYLTFFLVMFIGTRVFNEEYLMGFKPLHTKVMEAIYLMLNKRHLNISIFLLSLLLIPVVFAVQLIGIIMVSNIPVAVLFWLIMLGAIVLEEIAKTLGLFVLIKNRLIYSRWDLLRLAALSALGFWLGEKLLLLLAMTFSTETTFTSALLGTNMFSGWLFFIPLILHIISTFMVVLLASRQRKLSYFCGILAGSVVHVIYNLIILLSSGALG